MNRKTNTIAAVCVVLSATLLAALGAEAGPNGCEETLFKANQAYKDGRFADAAAGYEQLVDSGQGNAHLYYNLGNAYFRLDELGRAILNYERARLLIPRDGDLNFNLAHARDRIRDAVPQSERPAETAFFWLKSLSLHELFWGFAAVNGLFWTILLVRLFYRAELAYYLFLVALAGWIIAGASFGLKWRQDAMDRRAVIVPEEVSILAGPDSLETVLFKLHSGTIVNHERSEGDWSLVGLPDKKRGWLESTSIERINSHAG